jgi:hypothetical protein
MQSMTTLMAEIYATCGCIDDSDYIKITEMKDKKRIIIWGPRFAGVKQRRGKKRPACICDTLSIASKQDSP